VWLPFTIQYNIDIYNVHVVSQRPKSEAQVVARGLGGKVGLKVALKRSKQQAIANFERECHI